MPLVDLVEVNQHHDAGFHGKPGQGDKSNGHGYAQVVSKEIHEPHAAHHRKGNGEQYDQRFGHIVKMNVEQDEYDCQGKRHHDLEPLLSPLHVLEPSAPFQGVSCRDLHPFRNRFPGVLYVGAQIHTPNIDLDPCVQPGVLALDGRRPLVQVKCGHLPQRDMFPPGSRNKHSTQRFQIVSKRPPVPEIDRITLQALHRLCDVHPSNGGHDHVLDILYGKPVTSRLFTLDIDVQVIPAKGLVRIRGYRAGHLTQNTGNLRGQILKDLEIRPGNLDAHGGPDPRGEHIQANLDGALHGGIGQPGELDRIVDGLVQFIRGHARPVFRPDVTQLFFDPAGKRQVGVPPVLVLLRPLVGWPEHDGCLDHAQRSRVCCGLRAADLAEHMMNLWKTRYDLIGLLEYFTALRDGDTRVCGGHPEEIPFIKRRHELASQLLEREPGDCNDQDCDQDNRLWKAQHELDERPIRPDEKTIQRILLLFRDLAPDEEGHEHRDDRNGQHGRRGHGKRLCVCQGPEQPSLLSLQGEHGKKGERNDHEGEEKRRPDFLGRLDHDLVVLFWGGFALLDTFQMFVRVLHHHHRGIHHHPDGDGDPTEAHDVCIDAELVHGGEADQNSHGQRKDRDKSASKMEEKNDAHEGDNDHLFGELSFQGVDRVRYQCGAIVDRDDFHALGQPCLDLFELLLHPLNGGQGVFAETHNDNSSGDFPFPVEIHQSTSEFGSQGYVCHFPEQNRRTAPAHPNRNNLQVLGGLDVTEPAYHVLVFAHFNDPATYVDVAPLDGLLDPVQRNVIPLQLHRIYCNLVLFHIAAHTGHLGHTLHAHQLVTKEPVLQGPEFLQVVFV